MKYNISDANRVKVSSPSLINSPIVSQLKLMVDEAYSDDISELDFYFIVPKFEELSILKAYQGVITEASHRALRKLAENVAKSYVLLLLQVRTALSGD
jgi:hypothetical protein